MKNVRFSKFIIAWLVPALLPQPVYPQVCTLRGGEPLTPIGGRIEYRVGYGEDFLCGFEEFGVPVSLPRIYKKLEISGQMSSTRYFDGSCSGVVTVGGSLSARSRGGTAALCGFSEYTNASTPAKKYRKQTISGSRQICYNFNNLCGGNPTLAIRTTEMFSGSFVYSMDNCTTLNSQVRNWGGEEVARSDNCAPVAMTQVDSVSLNFDPTGGDPTRCPLTTLTPTKKTATGTGTCINTVVKSGIVSAELSDEDTEQDAVARATASQAWSIPGSTINHTSFRIRNPANFNISYRQAQTQVGFSTGLVAGRDYEVTVKLFRRAAGTTDAFVDSGQTLTATFNATGASYTGDWLDLPHESAWEYRAESAQAATTYTEVTADSWNRTEDHRPGLAAIPRLCWPTVTENGTRTFEGNPVAWPFTTPPVSPSSSYGNGVTVLTSSGTTRTTNGKNQCLPDTAQPGQFLKHSGSVQETLSEEYTYDEALARARSLADSAFAAASFASTAAFATPPGAFESSLTPALSVKVQRVDYQARFNIGCPGEYDIYTTFGERPLGSAGAYTEKTVAVAREHFASGLRTLTGRINVTSKDVEYTVLGIELRQPCADKPPGDADIRIESVHVGLSLGQGVGRTSAGEILLEADTVTADLYTPAALVPAATADGTVVVRDEFDVLRQVKTAQSLADVVTLDASSYEVRFYTPDNVGEPDEETGIHPVGGTPFVTYRFENPDAGQSARLRVTETRGSSVRVHVFEQSGGTLALSRGNGLRKESMTVSASGADTVKTTTVRNPDDSIATKTVRTYRDFGWGEQLTSEVLDPDGAALATVYAYYDDPDADGASYGLLKQRTNPDGSWERHTYDASGRPLKTVRPFVNSAVTDAEYSSRVTDYTYAALTDADGDSIDEELTTIVESTLGQETGRSYAVEWSKPVTLGAEDFNRRSDIRCTVSGAVWNASSNLVTETLSHGQGPFNGRTGRVINPDGTVTLTAYTLDSNGQQTAITKSGSPDATLDDIVDGTRTVTFTSAQGQVVSESVTDIASGLALSAWTATEFDALGRPTRMDFSDGTYETRDYACCGLASMRDRTGAITSYEYDALGRPTHETRLGITTRTAYDADDRVKSVIRIGADASEMVRETRAYDLAGRLTESRDALNRLTAFAEVFNVALGHTTRATTNPDTGTVVEVSARDGSRLSVAGTAAAPRVYEYGLESGRLFTKEILVGEGGATTEWVKTITDFAGRPAREERPSGSGVTVTLTFTYNPLGQLVAQSDADGIATLFAYNARGEQVVTALDVNGNGIIDYSGSDRVTRTVNSVALRDTHVVQKSVTEVWETDGQDTPTTVSVSEQSVDGLRTWQTVRGLTTSSVTTLDGSGGRTVVTTAPDGTVTTQVYAEDRLSSLVTSHSSLGTLGSTTYAHDAHGRLESSTDARNGTTTYAYFADDQIQTVTTPDPDPAQSGPGYDPQTTTFGYDAAGRQNSVTQPDGGQGGSAAGGIVTTEYYPTGQVKKTAGARTYPVEYTYDPQGRVKTLKTWQDHANNAGAAVTTWNYDPQRGFLLNKRYQDSTGPTYAYYPSGRLLTRTWARGVVTTYAYGPAGDLTGVDYSDTTPDVTIGYDRAGRPTNMTDGAGTRTLSYHASGQLLDEIYTAGLMNDLSVTRTFDSLHRLSSVASLSSLPSVNYSYDAASRLETVTSGVNTATYAYLPNSPLVGSVTFKNGTSTRLTTVMTYDNLNRLAAVTNASPSFPSLASVQYRYNSANQRTKLTRETNAYWDYGYDALGQVTSAAKKLSTGVPVLGHDFSYTFDDIGNRKTATANGLTSDYTANLLNQYDSRTVPGVVDIMGAAQPDAKVTVTVGNGLPQPVTRQDGLFFKQVIVDNSTTAVANPVVITGVKNNIGPNGEDAVTEIDRFNFTSKSPETYSHDPDGNLTGDARWNYTWDGENRLIAMETTSSAVTAGTPKQKLEFAYDGQSRRIAKKVYGWDTTSGSWILDSSLLFLYDGWNLIAELSVVGGQSSVVRSYTWGLDLSGSMQGAGGVGGLLFATHHSSQVTHHSASFDGNGNVIGLIDMSDGSRSAEFEYGAFGETLKVDGLAADAMPFRFSTKYTDVESGLLYYGLRYYNPSLGRWLNRDPIEEGDGVNIYAFLVNASIGVVDTLGDQMWLPSRPGVSPPFPIHPPIRPDAHVPGWARGTNINLPGINLVNSVSGSVTTCVGTAGVALCAAVSTAIERGTCCQKGVRRTYVRQQITGRLFIRGGIWSPVSARIRAPVVRDLGECPVEGNSGEGALFVRATAGIGFGECNWRPDRGWSCTGGFTTPLSPLNADIGGSFTVRNVWFQ